MESGFSRRDDTNAAKSETLAHAFLCFSISREGDRNAELYPQRHSIILLHVTFIALSRPARFNLQIFYFKHTFNHESLSTALSSYETKKQPKLSRMLDKFLWKYKIPCPCDDGLGHSVNSICQFARFSWPDSSPGSLLGPSALSSCCCSSALEGVTFSS